MVNEHTRLKVAPEVTYQQAGDGADETVILSLGSGMLFTCNATTRRFLDALDGTKTLAQVAEELESVYDVPAEKLRADLTTLARRLADEKLVAAT